MTQYESEAKTNVAAFARKTVERNIGTRLGAGLRTHVGPPLFLKIDDARNSRRNKVRLW
jgi:hypothetical protein